MVGGNEKNVLIVEDEAAIARTVRAYLERDGYRVLTARTGTEGLEAYRRERPDLVVLDWMLPGLSGLDVLRAIRAAGDTAVKLRTPLAGLRSYVEALRDGVLPADAANLDAILAETLRLERLVEDLRELSLLEARGVAFHLGPVDAGQVIQRVLVVHEAAAGRLGVSLAAHVPPALPPARADADRLAQVIHNLVANALTHTPRGGRVTVSASAETPPRRTAAGEAPPPASSGAAPSPRRFLTVTVTDTGPGIPAEALPYVFERFYRVDPSRRRETGGSGLGLTIARALVERMGGRIWVESEPGAGARFSFTVPAWTLKPASLGSDRS